MKIKRRRLALAVGLPLILVTAAGTAAVITLRLYQRPHFIKNYEEEEYAANRPFVEPTAVSDGLAIYSVGQGEPLLLFPYPHGQATVPMAQGALAELLAGIGRTGMGRRVITFDVPGAFRSTREPAGDMAEMLRSADQTLEHLGIDGPVDVVGHSMSGFCALAFAVERPERTRRLLLFSSMSGFPAATKWGKIFSVQDPDFWRLAVWSLRVNAGRGDLALHKKLANLMQGANFYDKSLFKPLEIDADDKNKGVPIRMIWNRNMVRRLSYADRLGAVRAPTLILVGRHDLETPLPAAEELVAGIPEATLSIFEKSGHFPFVEEPSLFTDIVADFLGA